MLGTEEVAGIMWGFAANNFFQAARAFQAWLPQMPSNPRILGPRRSSTMRPWRRSDWCRAKGPNQEMGTFRLPVHAVECVPDYLSRPAGLVKVGAGRVCQ